MSDPADDTPPGDAEQPVPGEAPFNSEHVLVPGESGAAEPGDDGYELANPPEAWKTAGPDWHRVEAMVSVTNPDAQAEALAQQRRLKSSKKSGHLKTLILCNLIVFMASVCVMVLELVASRLIAKHVGSSLYTWTSVIGVVLAGITVGNFLGGWLADRFDHEKLLPKLFLLASASSFSVLWLDRLLAGRTRPDSIDWPMWVFLTVAEMFFLPAVMLGTISPVVASMALKRGRKTGMTVGNVYAWGAMGSIVGTFLTGFYLIDAFGTRLIIGGTAGTLAVLGIAIASKQLLYRTAVVCGWLQFLVFTTAAASISSEFLGDLGESVGGFVAERDADVVELESWYNDTWSLKLDEALRNRLLKTLHRGSIEGLSEDTQNSLEQWLRSGYRKHLNEEHNAAIEAFIAATKVERESIDEWRIHGEELGRAMHEVGLRLYLRDDLTGEYHDESNYSYVNVHDGFEGDDMVRQLRLDKLVHSYFNPEDPTKLYYEYEQIYAEATHRVTAGWQRETSVDLEAFSGLDRIEPSMPDWIWFDAETNRLTAQGIVDEDRRKELMRLAPHGDYWLAVEKIAEDTRAEYWGGLSTASLEKLPPGVSTQKFLLDRLTFSSTFQTLDAFRELNDDDVQQLCNLGDAGKAVAWRTAVNQLSHQSRRVNAFFIGGGGFIFPRWIEAEYSSASRIDVAELDPAVKQAVQLHMGLPPDDQTAVNTIIGDARNVVDDLLKTSANGAGQYDFIYGDAFNGFSVPWHLTTREFNQKVRELLNPAGGVYLINVIDMWPRTMIAGSFTPPTTEPSNTAFPSQLAIDPDVLTNWQYAPSGFGGLEVLPPTNGDWKFSARGVMPESLRDRLIKSADRNGMAAFRQAVEAAYTESRATQCGRFLSCCVATLAEVFPNIYVFSTSFGPPADTRDTFVVIASLPSLDLESIEATGFHWTTAPFATRETRDGEGETTSGQWDALLATSRGLVLTDDFAPVDNLLRPVFEDQD